jgi:hypothetical protein
MIWDWGWTWKNIDVRGSKIAIDASEVTDVPNEDTGKYQGTGVRNYSASPFIYLGTKVMVKKAYPRRSFLIYIY